MGAPFSDRPSAAAPRYVFRPAFTLIPAWWNAPHIYGLQAKPQTYECSRLRIHGLPPTIGRAGSRVAALKHDNSENTMAMIPTSGASR
jgi:hypothetical protein